MKNLTLLLSTQRARVIALIVVGLLVILGVSLAVVINMNKERRVGDTNTPATTSETQNDTGETVGESNPQKTEEQKKTEDAKKDDKKAEQPASSTGSSSAGESSSTGGSTGSTGGSTGGNGGTTTPTQSCPAYPSFPDASCTGVPSGVTLSAYGGSCTVTANNTVIDSKTINCSPLSIQATNVSIKNSRINGTVATPNNSLAYSFSITDSEVIAPQANAVEQTGIGEANFTVLRVEVTGGNRSIYCRKNCTIQDSWVHGQNIADSPRVHASGIRQSQGGTIIHNRIHCSAEDTSSGGGCSANLTGYGDFEAVQDNTIEKNLFVATPAGACAYGGSSGDDGSKPFGHLAQNIIFKDNIFQRGSGNCGWYFPITDFDDTRPGNQWINNKWDDGSVLPPAN